MKPAPFAYVRAESLADAAAQLAAAGGDAKLLAGGQSLVPAMSFRLARPDRLVDIGGLSEARDLESTADGLRIGALVRHAELEQSATLEGPWRALREASRFIGHYPIRVRGTFGGSIAHGDPAAELPVVSLAFDARFTVRSSSGERTLRADEFFLAPFLTALDPTEIVVEASLPARPGSTLSAWEEFSQRTGDYALASVCVVADVVDGRVSSAAVALGAVGATPLRVTEAGEILIGSSLEDDAVEDASHAAARAADPVDDTHASADYRRRLVAALVARALRRIRADMAP